MGEKRTMADNVIRLLFSIVPFALSYLFFLWTFEGYTVKGWLFDPLRDVIDLSFALCAFFFGVFLVHSFFARVLFFIFLGFIGFLGLISVIFFWHDVGGHQLIGFERTSSNREYCFYIFTFCLGFGLLLFNWRVGKFLVINCLIAFSVLYALTGCIGGEYYKVIVSLLGLFVAKIARKNLTAVLFNFPSLIWLDYIFKDILGVSGGQFDIQLILLLLIMLSIYSPFLWFTIWAGLNLDEKDMYEFCLVFKESNRSNHSDLF